MSKSQSLSKTQYVTRDYSLWFMHLKIEFTLPRLNSDEFSVSVAPFLTIIEHLPFYY